MAHLVREVFAAHLPQADLRVLYEVSHNTCKLETHRVDGHARELYARRKGATRAWAPGASAAATRAAPAWTAGADRRLDGQRLVRDGRDGAVAYKYVAAVVDAAHAAGLARKAAKLTPLVCIKG